MEPFSMALMMGAGLGLQLFGMNEQQDAQDKYNQYQIQNIGLEQDVNDKRQQAMELDARRRSLENVRNTQRASAMATQAAVTQGAQYGSGLAGGLAQVRSQGAWNQAGISQNLAIGEGIFALDKQISQGKINMAYAGQDIQTAQGYSSLGQSLFSSAGAFGRLASGWSSPSSSSSTTSTAAPAWTSGFGYQTYGY